MYPAIFCSTAILAVGQSGILPDKFHIAAGEKPVLPASRAAAEDSAKQAASDLTAD